MRLAIAFMKIKKRISNNICLTEGIIYTVLAKGLLLLKGELDFMINEDKYSEVLLK